MSAGRASSTPYWTQGLGGFLYDGLKTDIRIEEVAWGGVSKGGIPDLIAPPVIPGGEADYMLPDDRVFGVSIDGQYRAYSSAS